MIPSIDQRLGELLLDLALPVRGRLLRGASLFRPCAQLIFQPVIQHLLIHGQNLRAGRSVQHMAQKLIKVDAAHQLPGVPCKNHFFIGRPKLVQHILVHRLTGQRGAALSVKTDDLLAPQPAVRGLQAGCRPPTDTGTTAKFPL